MDPELLKLLTSARSTDSNRNMSSVLRNIQTPLLAYMAGIPTQQGMGVDMPLTQAYSNSADPVVQQILNQVNTGIDEYALKSWLASQEANPEFAQMLAQAGWQPEDLEGLAVELQRERKNAGKSAGDDWWAKIGLAAPGQGYDEQNVPLDDESALRIADLRLAQEQATRRLASARGREKTAIAKAGPGYGRDWSSKDMAKYIMGTTQGQKMAKEAGVDLGKIDPNTGEVYRLGTSKWKKRPWYRPDRMLGDLVVRESSRFLEDFVDLQRGKQNKDVKDLIPGLTPSPEALKRIDAEKKAIMRAQQELGFASAQEQAIRRGRARAFSEAGKTPTDDQLKTILRFMSGK